MDALGPDFFGEAVTSGAADMAHHGGAAVLHAVIAMGEVVRIVRWPAVPRGRVIERYSDWDRLIR